MADQATLDQAVDGAIAACGDDARAAVRALLLANAYLEAEVERLADAVSRGYARGRLARESPHQRHDGERGSR
jgi:hypothetical protein